MATVWLGNHNAVDHTVTHDADGQPVLDDRGEPHLTRTPVDGKRCTQVDLPNNITPAEAFTTITHPQGVWAAHSNANNPVWVAATDPNLAALLGAWWDCEIREPEPDPGV